MHEDDDGYDQRGLEAQEALFGQRDPYGLGERQRRQQMSQRGAPRDRGASA